LAGVSDHINLSQSYVKNLLPQRLIEKSSEEKEKVKEKEKEKRKRSGCNLLYPLFPLIPAIGRGRAPLRIPIESNFGIFSI